MDAMGVWSTEWAASLFAEAMKFWFYSISLSITLSLIQLYWSLGGSFKETIGSSEKSSKEVDAGAKWATALQRNLVKKLAIDCCDIFIPGFTTGWLVVSSGTVGMLGMISTTLTSTDIWKRLQKP